MQIISTTPFGEVAVFSPIFGGEGIFAINQMTVDVWLCNWGLYSISLMYVSVLRTEYHTAIIIRGLYCDSKPGIVVSTATLFIVQDF